MSTSATTLETRDGLLEIASEHRLRAENLAFDIDVWYPLVARADVTFRTRFLPLQRDEARAMLNYQETRYNARPRLTTEDVRVLEQLRTRIDAHLTQHFSSRGAFLRLCGRSPKDGEPLQRDAVLRRYRANLCLAQLRAMSLSGDIGASHSSAQLIAIARTHFLRVTNGHEAMSLLLTSERVFADLIDWMQYGEPEQVVLREWDDDVSLDYEFRLFVWRGRVTGISQYDHYGVYPHLHAQKQYLQDALLRMWRRIHVLLGEETYVLDLVYLPNSRRFRIAMIELSPFRDCTGSALFKWSTDRELLTREGDLEPEFRLNGVLHPQLEHLVQEWVQRWSDEQKHYSHFYAQARRDDSAAPHDDDYEQSSMSRALLTAPLVTAAATIAASSFIADSYPLASVALIAVAASSYVVGQHFVSARRSSPLRTTLFVYGTLKRSFHWHDKFLAGSQFVCRASTCTRYPLVVGASGVPYLLGDMNDEGRHVKGEVWRVSDETLQGLDEYEGVGKGYYARQLIEVLPECSRLQTIMQLVSASYSMQAHVYVRLHAPANLRKPPYFKEYSLEQHRFYRPIRHILVKQLQYLGELPADDR